MNAVQGIWKTWIVAWCWAIVAFGAVLAGTVFSNTDGGARFIFALLGGGSSPAVFDPPGLRFAFGLLGAMSIGWGLTIRGFVRTSDDAAGWRALTVAVCVWFVTDSTISMISGYPLNAVSNVALLAAYLVPIFGSGVLRAPARTTAS